MKKTDWKIRAIKWLLRQLDDDELRLRLGHSLVLANPEPELYLQIVYGEQEDEVFDLTFDPEAWVRIHHTMQEMAWRVEREYRPIEKER